MLVILALHACGPLETLIPPPGAPRTTGPTAESMVDMRTIGDPVLERVRALLAQAESTTYEAEAETFTAKAQELMTRHAIDLAMLAEASGGNHSAGKPQTIRVPIDDPYADMKSVMLHIVAEVSRCRTVFHPHYSFATVVGFAHDLASTEVLHLAHPF